MASKTYYEPRRSAQRAARRRIAEDYDRAASEASMGHRAAARRLAASARRTARGIAAIDAALAESAA